LEKTVAKPFLSRRNRRRAARVRQGRFASLAPPSAVLRILDQHEPPAEFGRHEEEGASQKPAMTQTNKLSPIYPVRFVTHLSAGQDVRRGKNPNKPKNRSWSLRVGFAL
jgi:hypothetical protein